MGIYFIKNNLITEFIGQVRNNNSQKEYYLPDLMLILIREKYDVKPVLLNNQDELVNINTQEDLKKAKNINSSVRFF